MRNGERKRSGRRREKEELERRKSREGGERVHERLNRRDKITQPLKVGVAASPSFPPIHLP